ncbi:MAG: DUF2778 domain-containing protein [Rhodospirillaceae bacterium]
MTDTAAAFYDVTSFDGRIFSLGDYRRVFRSIGDGIVISLGTVAAACLLVGTVTVAAAWIVNTALATNPHIRAQAPMGPGALALVRYGPSLYGPSLSAVTDLSAPAQIETDAAEDPDVTFESKWARVTASAPTSAVALAPTRAPEQANNAPTPPSSEVPQSPARPEIAYAPDSTQVAKLTSAAALPSASSSMMPSPPRSIPERANSVPLPRPHPARDIVQSPAQAPAQVVVAAPTPVPTPENRAPPQQAHNKGTALPDPNSRTAVYDISARTVYLPSGKKLEAHSGLGDKMDDPRYIHVKMRGPTPPNVYELTLREKLFHGVRAIRLNPVDDGKMFGRDGMLAHTYMLGPNGQSNGCVSFKDYRAFLNAYLRGEVDRLVVVSHLGDAPVRTARAPRGHVRRYASTDQTAGPSIAAW